MNLEKMRGPALAAMIGIIPPGLGAFAFHQNAYAEEAVVFPSPESGRSSGFSTVPGALGVLPPCAEGVSIEDQARPIIRLLQDITRLVSAGKVDGSPEELTRGIRPGLRNCSAAFFDSVENAFTYVPIEGEDTLDQYTRYGNVLFARSLAQALRQQAGSPGRGAPTGAQ